MKQRHFSRILQTLALLALAGVFSSSSMAGEGEKKVAAPGSRLPELSVGNANIYWLLDSWGSPLLPPNWPTDGNTKKAIGNRELDVLLARAAEVGAGYVEDYIGWGVIEPQEKQWRWDIYHESAAKIRNAGNKYIPMVWVQNLPSWVRLNPKYARAHCIEHGQETESLSIFARQTTEVYERLFANLKQDLGALIEIVRVGIPHDFGESTYPAGLAAYAFPMRHQHEGFWAAERQHQQALLARFRQLASALSRNSPPLLV